MKRSHQLTRDEIAAQRHAAFSRRRFLKGVGACMALPALESLISTQALAAAAGSAGATSAGAPLRMAFIYFPNGAIPATWWPTGEGSSFELAKTMQPLDPVKNMIQVLGGLDQKESM